MVLAGCGQSGGDGGSAEDSGAATPSTSASTSASTGASIGVEADGAASVDPADPGEDLLDDVVRGVVIKGTDRNLTWKFPETYETSDAQQASSQDEDGAKYDLAIGFKAGTDSRTEGQALADRADADQEVTVDEVEVGGKPIVTTATDSTSGSLRTYFWSPDGVDGTYAVLLFAYDTTVADTPGERLDEVYQTVGSLDLEAAP
ncbi:hypothetical protein ASG49_17720 [Marmoricola sp. Leaf446]|nr:hypothetical protein ASG49_17720 [Marmoricola sp. Leaf446]